MPLSENVYCVAIVFKVTEQVEQWICIKFCIKLEHCSTATIQVIQKATAKVSFITPAHTLWLVQNYLAKHQITQVTQLPYSPDLVPWNFWLFPKLKSPLKGKRFQTVHEIQENIMGQLIGRTVWGSKLPTLKETGESLSSVQCFLSLVSSSINVPIFHITWLDTFWTDLV